MPWRGSKHRASVLRCKPCRNPDDIHDLPKHLPADLTKYVLSSFSTRSPPIHATLDGFSPPPARLVVDQISGHQLVLDRGGVLAVVYETHWAELLSPYWEHERDLQHHRPPILRYWSGIPSQHRQVNRLHRQMRIEAAYRELSRSRGEIFLAPGNSLVPCPLWLHRFSFLTLPAGAHLRCKACDGLWRLSKVAPRASIDNSSADSYIIRFLNDPAPIKIKLLLPLYPTSRNAARGSWCLQRHQAGGLARAVLRNAIQTPTPTRPLDQLTVADDWRIR